jgi:uncharacterized protein
MRTGRRRESVIQSLSTLELAYCAVVIVVAYAARGSTGFGAAAAMPLMGLVVPMKVLVPAWTLLGIVAGLSLLGTDRRNISWIDIARVLPTCLIGIVIGVWLFTRLDARTLAQGLGLLVIGYGVYALWGTFRKLTPPQLPGNVVGPVAGLVGGMVGATFGTLASLFFAMYLDAIRLAKEAFRATMTALLLALTVSRGIGYWVVGEFTRDVLLMFAATLPMMLIGIYIGNRIHTGLDETTFRRLVSAALIISGLALLVK